MTNETSEDIPEISSGYGHVFNCCTRCGHFHIDINELHFLLFFILG